MTEVDLIKALPGGGTIAAFIVIVILFLWHQKRIDARTDMMTNMFAAQIKDFTAEMLTLTEETIAAIKGLEDAIRNLSNQIKKWDPYLQRLGTDGRP
jgi:hypothetical protein